MEPSYTCGFVVCDRSVLYSPKMYRFFLPLLHHWYGEWCFHFAVTNVVSLLNWFTFSKEKIEYVILQVPVWLEKSVGIFNIEYYNVYTCSTCDHVCCIHDFLWDWNEFVYRCANRRCSTAFGRDERWHQNWNCRTQDNSPADFRIHSIPFGCETVEKKN